jgi:5-methylcytosine-specific restriction endonuclease McrA
VERWPGRALLVWCIHENHAFFWEGAAVLRKLMSRSVPTGAVKVRREAKESTTPAVSQWLPWCCPKPGHFWAYEGDDIDAVRGEFLRQDRHPKVILKDGSRIKSLRYTFSKRAGDQEHKGVCVVHALPQDWREIEAWFGHLDIGLEYRGEGLAGACYKALTQLLRKKDRVYLTGIEKNELLERYDYACALCGAKDELEWDHIVALSTSFGEQAFEPLCGQCHSAKTMEEPRSFGGDPLESHFCPAVWKAYVESERTPPLIHKVAAYGELEGCWIADVRRCRRNALLHCAHEIPVFSCLDDVRPMQDMVLGARGPEFRDQGGHGPHSATGVHGVRLAA